MKVLVSVGGKFHAFDLASQLEKRGLLERLITSYPSYTVDGYAINRSRVISLLTKEVLVRGWYKFPSFIRSRVQPYYYINSLFDWSASHHVVPCDIAVAWSSFALNTLRVAKKQGAKTIVEHGSSHPVYQRDILQEENEKWGTSIEISGNSIIDREIQEFSEADYIAIPSHFVRQTFIDQGVLPEKLIQVPYGVDLSAFHQVPKTDSVFRLIFVGTICVRKGIHYLLRAFHELALPNAELVFVGNVDPDILPFFKKYEGSFRYMGHQKFTELYNSFSQSSVFVMPSLEEGLARVIPQSMACGLPVICTTNTGGADVVREGVDGYIIPIRSVEALKEKILYLYQHQDQCRAMGQSAKERVSQGFTWDDYGEKIVEAYTKIISNV